MKKSLLFYLSMCVSLALFACSDSSSSTSGPSSSDSSGGSSDISSSSAVVTQMQCNEIMFHHTDELEWVEISIASGPDLESMAAYNLHLSGAVTYYFPDEPLKSGEYIVVTNDQALFRSTYPDFSGRLFGPFEDGGNLPNSGDVVSIKIKGAGDVDCSFDDDPPWPSLADGKGSSLVYLGGSASLAQNWGASKTLHGNPGSGDDPVYSPVSVRINEVYPTDGAPGAWIELYNDGKKDVDVSGWKIIAKKRGDTLTIPKNSVVPSGGYLVLEDLDDIVLMTRGENLYLREYVNGEWTYSETGLEYPATGDNSAGVLISSDGTWIQGSLEKKTKGKENISALNMGPLYINEVYYNPTDNIEFLELINLADTAVTLSQTATCGKPGYWTISGIGDVSLGSVTVSPGGLVLLLSAQDMSLYSVDSAKYAATLSDNVILRTFSGKLSNRGERLVVKQPYDCTTSSTSSLVDWYYRWSDAVLYSDDGYWPVEADGGGMSLHRVDFTLPGSDPAAWEAKPPTPGK